MAHKLSGTPTAAGTYTFTAKAENAYGSDEQSYTVTITASVYTWKKYSVVSQFAKQPRLPFTYPTDKTIAYYFRKDKDVPFTAEYGWENIGGTRRTITEQDGFEDAQSYFLAVTISATETRKREYYWWKERNGIWCWLMSDDPAIKTDTQGTYISDVTSADRSAYPDNGAKDGFWYIFQG